MPNENFFVTEAEAEAVKKMIPDFVGQGVKEIYAPVWWDGTSPTIGDKKFLHFRFENGAEGFNIGQIKQYMKIFPFRWVSMLAAEVNAPPMF